ncbi:MAG: hypothetical protein N2Z62_01820 [Rhodobacteraceae bacterium]|nr:hypothetical protein [Paracoccaceae bacterium]
MSFLDRVKPAADDCPDAEADDRFGARLAALTAADNRPAGPRPSPFASVRTRPQRPEA